MGKKGKLALGGLTVILAAVVTLGYVRADDFDPPHVKPDPHAAKASDATAEWAFRYREGTVSDEEQNDEKQEVIEALPSQGGLPGETAPTPVDYFRVFPDLWLVEKHHKDYELVKTQARLFRQVDLSPNESEAQMNAAFSAAREWYADKLISAGWVACPYPKAEPPDRFGGFDADYCRIVGSRVHVIDLKFWPGFDLDRNTYEVNWNSPLNPQINETYTIADRSFVLDSSGNLSSPDKSIRDPRDHHVYPIPL